MIWLILGLSPVVGFVCWMIYAAITDYAWRRTFLTVAGVMLVVGLPVWSIVYGLDQMGVRP